MHRSIRIVLLIFSTLILAGFIFFSIGYRFVLRSLPVTSGTAEYAELQNKVDVYRDDLGIPYILSENAADLFFAQGLITAQDRFFQMDLNRHIAAGQSGLFFSHSGLRTDSLMRTVNLSDRAAADYKTLPAELQSIFQSYSAGVNAYLNQYEGRLPIEYTLMNRKADLWKPEESLALYYLHTWIRQPDGLIQTLNRHCKTEDQSVSDRCVEKILNEGLLDLPSLSSAGWIVSGRKTRSGRPILAAIANEPAVQPGVWYELHLFSPDLRSGGLSLPGVPMIWSGQNGSVAWISLVHQIKDFKFNPDATEPFKPDIAFWSLLYAAMGSSSVKGLKRNHDRHMDSDWIMLCADTLGDTGIFPDRYLDNPSDMEWIASDGTRVAANRGSLEENARPLKRLAALLNEKGIFTPHRIRQIQSDDQSEFAVAFLKAALPIVEKKRDADPLVAEILDRLAAWKGDMKPGSSEALIVQTWLAKLFQKENPPCLFNQLPSVWLPLFLKKWESENGIIVEQSFLDAVESLRKQWGDDLSLWSWGAAHQVKFQHKLRGNPLLDRVMNLGPFHSGGSAMTLYGAGHPITRPDQIKWIQAARIILPLNDLNRTVSALSTGQSGQPASPHYRDQVALFLSNQVHPNLTDLDRIRLSGWKHITFKTEGEYGEEK